MSDVEQSSLDWTPKQALTEALEETEKNDPCAAFIVLLWRDRPRDGYDSNFWNAGLSASEAVALLEVQKQKLLQVILGPAGEDEP